MKTCIIIGIISGCIISGVSMSLIMIISKTQASCVSTHCVVQWTAPWGHLESCLAGCCQCQEIEIVHFVLMNKMLFDSLLVFMEIGCRHTKLMKMRTTVVHECWLDFWMRTCAHNINMLFMKI